MILRADCMKMEIQFLSTQYCSKITSCISKAPCLGAKKTLPTISLQQQLQEHITSNVQLLETMIALSWEQSSVTISKSLMRILQGLRASLSRLFLLFMLIEHQPPPPLKSQSTSILKISFLDKHTPSIGSCAVLDMTSVNYTTSGLQEAETTLLKPKAKSLSLLREARIQKPSPSLTLE